MSFADGEQPAEQGQDAPGTGGEPPYAEYLQRIPEQLRGEVEPVFKEWDANTTKRFQEHSEFRKDWEPYQETGINQFAPEEVQWLSQFRQALDNPQAIQEWYQSYAEQNGLTEAEAQQELEDQPFGELDGLDDDTAGLFRQQLEQQLGPISQELQELRQWREQQESQRAEAQAMEQIESQIADLEKKHPEEFDRDLVDLLIPNYLNDPRNAVSKAFEASQQLVNKISKNTLQSKVGLPPSPEFGGAPDGTPPEVKTMKEAGAFALARLREANRQ